MKSAIRLPPRRRTGLRGTGPVALLRGPGRAAVRLRPAGAAYRAPRPTAIAARTKKNRAAPGRTYRHGEHLLSRTAKVREKRDAEPNRDEGNRRRLPSGGCARLGEALRAPVSFESTGRRRGTQPAGPIACYT